MERIELAQIAYRAYGTWLGWKTPQGTALPGWNELPMNVKNAWTSAIEMAAIQVRNELTSLELPVR
jgi:hypothetical protein